MFNRHTPSKSCTKNILTLKKKGQLGGGYSLENNKPHKGFMTLCVLGSIGLCTVIFLGIRSRFGPAIPKPQVTKGKAVSVYVDDGTGVYRANEDGTFPTDGYVLNTELSGCANGGVLSQNPEDKTISLSVSGSDQCHVYFDKAQPKAIEQIIASSKGALTTSFALAASTAQSAGVYELADEEGTKSYYFRGPVENNYVKFGSWMDSSNANYGKDMYWRIIRVNGDGSMRMIYAGTQAYANGSQGDDTFIGASAFNPTYNDAKYVGYMYAPTGTDPSTSKEEAQTNTESSTIKGVLETWYANNLETNYGQYISKDAIYCYDRSTPGESATGWTEDTGLGYGQNYTGYGAMARTGWNSAATASAPNFVCIKNNDKFTVEESTIGNKVLSKPVGLISADEILAAGSGEYGTESDYYLKRFSWYWSGSPSGYNDIAGVIIVHTKGGLTGYNVSSVGAVAPVINLTPEYAKTLVGDGTITSPYHS